MLKFLLLVLAINLIGVFLERMKRNAQKRKQMEYDEGMGETDEEQFTEEEPPSPPVIASPEDILGDIFKKLEAKPHAPHTESLPDYKQSQSHQNQHDLANEGHLEEPALGSLPKYREFEAKEFSVSEAPKQEHEKIRDGRGLIEMMEAAMNPSPNSNSLEAKRDNLTQESLETETAEIVSHSGKKNFIRVNLRDGVILKEILGSPRSLQPWSA